MLRRKEKDAVSSAVGHRGTCFAHLIPWNDLHSLEIMCYIKQKCVMGTLFSSRDSTGIKLPNMRAACLGNHQHYQTYKSTWLWKALRSRFMTHSLRP